MGLSFMHHFMHPFMDRSFGTYAKIYVKANISPSDMHTYMCVSGV